MISETFRGYRPRQQSEEVLAEDRSIASLDMVELAKARHETGLNMWTGKPLTGHDARQWMRVWCGLPEEPNEDDDEGDEIWGLGIAAIISVENNEARFLMTDKKIVHIRRRVEPAPPGMMRKFIIKADLVEIQNAA